MRSVIPLLVLCRTAAGAPAPTNLLTSVPAIVAVSSTVDNSTIVPEHLVDGKLETAWNSRTDELEGAWIGFRLPANVHVTTIKLTVGFTKVDKKLGDLFTMNPRIKTVRVIHDGTSIATTLDPELRTLQDIAIDGGGGDYRIEIVKLVPGTKKTWREVNVSELEVWGTLTSGTAKAQKPVVHVGSFEQNALTRAQCVNAMYPNAKGARISGEADADKIVGFSTLMIGGGLDVCRIDHVADGTDAEAVAELAVVKRTPRLGVVQRLAPLPAFKHDRGPMGSDEKLVDVGTFDLTTTETGLLVSATSHNFGGSYDGGTKTTNLYRVSPSAVTQVLELTSTWSAGESGDDDTCTLQQEPVVAKLQDLHVTCIQTHSRYPGNKDDVDWRKERTETYRWKGSAYVKSEKR